MAKRFISPSLADITQDIAGVIPVDIVKNWTKTSRSLDDHAQILQSFVKRGTVISSDSAGLSKISGQRTLLEVMQLVNHPKDVLFRYGSSIGGTAIGIWAADNTQMFFDESIPVDKIISTMIQVQRDLIDYPLQVGIAIHTGEFLEIGGGLYGEEADKVESLAENDTKGGETLITEETKNLIKRDIFSLSKRSALGVYSVIHSDQALQISYSTKEIYPIPFSKEFYDDISKSDLSNAQIYKALNAKYSQNKIVVLVKVLHQKQPLLLDELTAWILANSLMNEIALEDRIQRIKSNGNLGIFVTEDLNAAIRFAQDMREVFNENGYDLSIGISEGEVFIFDMPDRGREIAGGPVNIASKLAEDSGEKSTILVDSSVGLISIKSKPFKIMISGVEITGIKI
jgi:class 3 adenylate cyclase